jgi:RimJ/RimL family protein N-acetyltransferase
MIDSARCHQAGDTRGVRPAPTGEHRRVPDITLEALARTFFREASGYGFERVDYVKFASLLLDQIIYARHPASDNGADGCKSSPVVIQNAEAGDSLTLPLRGRRVLVREMCTERDLPLFEQWVSDAQGRFFLLSRTGSRNVSVTELVTSPTSTVGIITTTDGDPIGAVAFLNVDQGQRKAELRKIVGDPKQRGKGFAREASALWIRYGLSRLGLKKIYLNTLHSDLRNVRLDEELGFRVEGILRNEVLIDGAYHDVLRMGLLHADFAPASLGDHVEEAEEVLASALGEG